MLDMGFIHDIRRVLALLPAKRQNLLFSATFPDEVRALASGFMRDPVTVEVARRNMPIELIAQVAHPVDKDRKRALLAHLVKSGNWQQVLVFCRTKHGANRLAEQLEHDGIETAPIHGNNSERTSRADNNARTSRAITSSGRASSAIPNNARASGRGLSPPHVRRGGAQRQGGPLRTPAAVRSGTPSPPCLRKKSSSRFARN